MNIFVQLVTRKLPDFTLACKSIKLQIIIIVSISQFRIQKRKKSYRSRRNDYNIDVESANKILSPYPL